MTGRWRETTFVLWDVQAPSPKVPARFSRLTARLLFAEGTVQHDEGYLEGRRRARAVAPWGRCAAAAQEGTMKRGTIDRLVRDRGFGFIRGERGESVFFHRSVLAAGEFEQLKEGDRVEFEETTGEKGPKATRVHRLAREAQAA